MVRLTLRLYAGLFVVVGFFFVARERLVLETFSWFGAWVGLAPLVPSGPSLWLGLTGSLMCVIAWLAFRLSRDTSQSVAWEALLLSKAVSSALFLVFLAQTGKILFLASAVVDGSIMVHLFFLRRLCDGGPGLAPRLAVPAPFYEVWFARLNDAATGRALWIRYTLLNRGGQNEAACWAVFFDPARGRVVSRRWEGGAAVGAADSIFRMGSSVLAPGLLEGSGEGVSWNLRWSPGPCPPAAVISSWVRASGLSSSGYDSVAPAARFQGSAVLDGETWDFAGASGSVGHVWGRSYNPGWWWAHSVFPGKDGDEAVFEILSAPGPLGVRITSAILWKDGRMHRSCGPLALLRNGSRREDDRWLFSARFGALTVEGECALGLAATLHYVGPRSEKLACRNSKVSAMRLRLDDGRETEELTTNAAAMEFAAPRV